MDNFNRFFILLFIWIFNKIGLGEILENLRSFGKIRKIIKIFYKQLSFILSERRQEERVNRQLDRQIQHAENAENGKF